MADEPSKPASKIVEATGTAVGTSHAGAVGASMAEATGAAAGSSSVWGDGEAWTMPPSNHPIYAQVGLVASRWTYVEHALDSIIWGLAGAGNNALMACLTGQFGSTFQRYNAIMALLGARGLLTPELRKRIENERGACGNTSAKRNRIVHDPWYLEIGGAVGAYRSWPKEDLRYGIRKIPESDIDDALKSITDRMNEAVQLRFDLMQWFS